MNRKTKAALAALFIAALATPAAAQGLVPYYNYSPSYAARSPGLIEGRNTAGFGDFGQFRGARSGRDAMVQSLGN